MLWFVPAAHNNTITLNLADVDLQPVVVRFMLKAFERNGVVVSLEWIPENSLYSYYVLIIPQPSFIIRLNRSSVQLKVLYNVLYNVSVVKTSPCGQRVYTVNELYYGKCHACTWKAQVSPSMDITA